MIRRDHVAHPAAAMASISDSVILHAINQHRVNGDEQLWRYIPGVPVLCQRVSRRVAVLKLAECPLVHNVVIACVFEETGGNPWL